eukprot:4866762-Pleurochrysis_carterae.AAC.1
MPSTATCEAAADGAGEDEDANVSGDDTAGGRRRRTRKRRSSTSSRHRRSSPHPIRAVDDDDIDDTGDADYVPDAP